MTPQEAFDKATSGVLRQGKAAIDAERKCLLRAPDGCKCAIGHLISDDDYKPEMELTAAGIQITGVDDWLLYKLRTDHDGSSAYNSNFLDFYLKASRRTATEFGLSTLALDNLAKELGL